MHEFKTIERAALEAVFRRRGWLALQPADFRDRILACARQRQVRVSETIYRDGDPPGGMYGIVSGGIGVRIGSPRSSPRLGHILRPGDWFGATPILTGGGRSLGFEAVEPSILLTVPLASLKAIGQADSDAIRRIGGQATQAMTLAASVAADLLIPQSAQRVAAVLLRVTAAEKGILPEHPDGFLLSQQLLAEMSNSSRNHVNQILGEFRAAGWVATRYNRIALTNVPKLLAFAYAE